MNGMNEANAIIGRFVWSKAGRDKSRLFIVVDRCDDDHVLIADGKLRLVENPKKKKLKHLMITGKSAWSDDERPISGSPAGNADLRAAIQRYMDEEVSV